MTDPDPDPVAADPGPTAAPVPEPLAERYPAGFDGENPRPLNIHIHPDWMAAGHDRIAVKRALGRYGQADRYRRALQTRVRGKTGACGAPGGAGENRGARLRPPG